MIPKRMDTFVRQGWDKIFEEFEAAGSRNVLDVALPDGRKFGDLTGTELLRLAAIYERLARNHKQEMRDLMEIANARGQFRKSRQ